MWTHITVRVHTAYLGLCLLFVSFGNVNCFGSGAPGSAKVCTELYPQHGVDEQFGEKPFWISATPVTYGRTNAVNVTIHSQYPFKGFILQARDDQESIVNGEFSESDGVKTLSCLNTRGNTLTHSNNRVKNSVSTIWTPHSSAVRIRFKATVVVEKLRFYRDVKSQAVDLKPSPSTATTEASKESTKPNAALNFREAAYQGCGDTKTCFAIGNCVPTKNCDILLTGELIAENVVRFNLYGNIRNAVGDRYFSMGISHNGKMTDSSVTDCIAVGNQNNVIIQDSWNNGYSNQIQTTSAIRPTSKKIEDGIVNCEWERDVVTNVNGQVFDLTKSYILLAHGAANREIKEKHDDRLESESVVNYKLTGVVGGSKTINPLIKAHGSLMVIAWLGIVSVGIMLARHYKGVWDDRRLLGQKVWFTCHRGLMLTAVICAVASMTCIFVLYKWKINTVHAYFGVAANICMILQPIGALFRCHPGTDNRWIFNWMHWLGGNTGQICALCAIFLATYLPATGLSMVFLWLVIAFLAMHITVHLILQIYSRFLVNDNKVSDNIAMQDIHGQKSAMIVEEGEYFKQLMLGVYVVLVAVVVLALILIIAFAKPQ